MTDEQMTRVRQWTEERDAIIEQWRSGKIANVANGRLAQLNSLLATAVAEFAPTR